MDKVKISKIESLYWKAMAQFAMSQGKTPQEKDKQAKEVLDEILLIINE